MKYLTSDWHLFKMPGGRRPSIDYNALDIVTGELRLTAIEDMNLEEELGRNNTWSPGFEHSGMSTLCQNQAYQIYLDSIIS